MIKLIHILKEIKTFPKYTLIPGAEYSTPSGNIFKFIKIISSEDGQIFYRFERKILNQYDSESPSIKDWPKDEIDRFIRKGLLKNKLAEIKTYSKDIIPLSNLEYRNDIDHHYPSINHSVNPNSYNSLYRIIDNKSDFDLWKRDWSELINPNSLFKIIPNKDKQYWNQGKYKLILYKK